MFKLQDFPELDDLGWCCEVMEQVGVLDKSVLWLAGPHVFASACNSTTKQIKFELKDMLAYRPFLQNAQGLTLLAAWPIMYLGGALFVCGDAIARDVGSSANNHWTGVWVQFTNKAPPTYSASFLNSDGAAASKEGRARSVADGFSAALVAGLTGGKQVSHDLAVIAVPEQTDGSSCGFFVLSWGAAITAALRAKQNPLRALSRVKQDLVNNVRASLASIGQQAPLRVAKSDIASRLPDFTKLVF